MEQKIKKDIDDNIIDYRNDLSNIKMNREDDSCPCCGYECVDDQIDWKHGDSLKGDAFKCPGCDSEFWDWFEFDPAIIEDIDDGNEAQEIVNIYAVYSYTQVSKDKYVNARIALNRDEKINEILKND